MSKHTVYILTGNTYPLRDEIKSIPHAKWDAGRKAWVIAPGTMAERSKQSAAVHALRKRGVAVEEEMK